jgi:hypothetical protein
MIIIYFFMILLLLFLLLTFQWLFSSSCVFLLFFFIIFFAIIILFPVYFQFFSHYQLIIYFLFIFLLFGVIVRLLAHFVHSLHHSLHSPSASRLFTHHSSPEAPLRGPNVVRRSGAGAGWQEHRESIPPIDLTSLVLLSSRLIHLRSLRSVLTSFTLHYVP